MSISMSVSPNSLSEVKQQLAELLRYPCPCTGTRCGWRGRLEHVLQHVLTQHQDIFILQGDDVILMARQTELDNTAADMDWLMLQNCFGQHFLVSVRKRVTPLGSKVFALVQLLGSREQAAEFTYSLEVQRHDRRMVWQSTPLSVQDSPDSAITVSDCLDLDWQRVKFFSNEGALAFNVVIARNYISKV